jgi:hypothetical protein
MRSRDDNAMTTRVGWWALVLGTATTLMVACGGDAQPRARVGSNGRDVRAAGGYRIVGDPIVSADEHEGVVTVRTNRPLPYRDFLVRADIRLNGRGGGFATERTGNRAHRCYVQVIEGARGRPGNTAVVTVRIEHVRKPLRVSVKMLTDAAVHRASRRLCGKRTIFDDPDNEP